MAMALLVHASVRSGLHPLAQRPVIGSSSMTFQSLVRRSSLSAIDTSQIDTEGYDYEIIKMAFSAGCVPPFLAFLSGSI
jgi:hypothetical protein